MIKSFNLVPVNLRNSFKQLKIIYSENYCYKKNLKVEDLENHFQILQKFVPNVELLDLSCFYIPLDYKVLLYLKNWERLNTLKLGCQTNKSEFKFKENFPKIRVAMH